MHNERNNDALPRFTGSSYCELGRTDRPTVCAIQYVPVAIPAGRPPMHSSLSQPGTPARLITGKSIVSCWQICTTLANERYRAGDAPRVHQRSLHSENPPPIPEPSPRSDSAPSRPRETKRFRSVSHPRFAREKSAFNYPCGHVFRIHRLLFEKWIFDAEKCLKPLTWSKREDCRRTCDVHEREN